MNRLLLPVLGGLAGLLLFLGIVHYVLTTSPAATAVLDDYRVGAYYTINNGKPVVLLDASYDPRYGHAVLTFKENGGLFQTFTVYTSDPRLRVEPANRQPSGG